MQPEKEKKEIKIAPETQKLNWYVNCPSFADVDLIRRRPISSSAIG